MSGEEKKSSEKSDRSDKSDSGRLIPKYGGYRKLRSFQTAQLVYDGTVAFCNRFVDKRSRTHDQMVQAARSGVQNIAEGSMASATSKKTELKLTGVARASLEELLLDFKDFLRQRGLRLWSKDSPEALAVRQRFRSDRSDSSDWSDDPEVAANTLICLIHQATYPLRRQLEGLERQFLNEGGFTEKLYRARTEARAREAGPPPRRSWNAQVDGVCFSLSLFRAALYCFFEKLLQAQLSKNVMKQSGRSALDLHGVLYSCTE